ncbi:MAG TPA: amidohydrolase family protein [Acidimicrobiales bacterium]|jgi:N-acyl-D-aspartate/D-glutamate deacylase|nr:amidohydrolase family protein [Acidimicrobiales bacterium]
MLDCKIAGASVVDGTGSPRRRADVGIRDGMITAVGEVDEGARRTIDASGLVVAPGFIDIHTHYDAQLFWDPSASPSPYHGVTTVVGGNCGFSIAPLAPEHADYVRRMLAKVEGMPIEALEAGLDWDWRSYGDWLDRLDGSLMVNAGFLVGHSAVRRSVMGEAAVGSEASDEQLATMVRVLHESLAAGGLGFSSSRAPTHNDGDGKPVPSRSATTEELVALAAALRDHPGTTLEFIPTVGAFEDEHMDLMASLSLAANRPLNWNLLAVTSQNPDGAANQLRASDYAAERGARVIALAVADPVEVRLTFLSGFILDALPGWSSTMSLPPAERMKALSDPDERRRLRDGAASPDAGLLRTMANWKTMRIAETFSPDNEGLSGRLVGDIAAERGEDPFDTLVDIVVADELRTGLLLPARGDDPESWRLRTELWRDPRVVIGASDAGAHLDMLATFIYTTSLVGPSVRDRHLLPLEEAVHMITDVPARLYGIRDRGRIAEGCHADIVVFDEDRVAPRPVATRFDLPSGAGRLYAEADGIEHVIVNGTEILGPDGLGGGRPGTLLRSGRDTDTVEVPGGRG